MTNISKLKPAEIAPIIIDELPPLAVERGSDDIFYYEDNHYKKFHKEDLFRFIYKFFMDNDSLDTWSRNKQEEIFSAIKYNPTKIALVDFNDHGPLLNVKNGVLDLDTLELKEHSPEYYFNYIVDVEYDPEAKECPTFKYFLESLFNHIDEERNITPDEETISAVLQICGYLLYPENKMEKFFMFLGNGANGKSLLIDVIKSFFPKEFITSLSLQILSSETSFQREQLQQSRINISAEEKGQKVDSEQIKRIVSGQDISVDRKFEKCLNIQPQAKIVVDSNGLPYFNDASYGTLRRIYALGFNNKFVPEDEYKNIQDPVSYRIFKQRDRNQFLDDIMKEKSAIFNLFLSGLKQLEANNWQLPETPNTQAIMKEYQEQTDSLGTFLLENYEAIQTPAWEGLRTEDVLNDFREYYERHFPGKQFGYSTKIIKKRINDLFRVSSEDRIRYNTNQRAVTETFHAIQYKKNEEAERLANLSFD